eukprot:COSAG02_NODE_9249_length_2278_cov_1.292795_4_plen_23_part_01
MQVPQELSQAAQQAAVDALKNDS